VVVKTTAASTTSIEVRYGPDDEEAPPTLGVREPRRPILPTLTPGAEAEVQRSSQTEAVAGAGVKEE
jgi:hypothetical protein